ncbi:MULTISPECIES: SDR family NAD(P)-dependent oxidoreductase [unclassified Streptomyces]|uniref:SDR family NAD(P)-dependent oxidoreductase n=1 Tax=unclassified Streptomyces TaxID=2593676 RepID=UPI004042EF58
MAEGEFGAGTGLVRQTVVVVGGSPGIGLETARQVRSAGGDVVLAARNAKRLQRAADELDPLSTAAFDARDTDHLERFLQELPRPVDHVMVTASSPSYTPLAEIDLADAGRDFGGPIAMMLAAARASREKVAADDCGGETSSRPTSEYHRPRRERGSGTRWRWERSRPASCRWKRPSSPRRQASGRWSGRHGTSK